MQTTKILAASFLAAALPAAGFCADALDRPKVFSVEQPSPAQPAKSGPICLRVRDIQDASSKDGKIMTFRMRDGTVYANHLRQDCDSLRYGGFVWTVNPTDEVCEGVQTLRTLTVGEVCRLGKFDPPVKSAAK